MMTMAWATDFPGDMERKLAEARAEIERLRAALKLAREYLNFSLGAGSDYTGPNPYPIIDAALNQSSNE